MCLENVCAHVFFFLVTYQHLLLPPKPQKTHQTLSSDGSIWSGLQTSNKPMSPQGRHYPSHLPDFLHAHMHIHTLDSEMPWVCVVIIKWQMTLWVAATLKWNVFLKAGGNRPCKRQSRLRKFRQGRDRHTRTHMHTLHALIRGIYCKFIFLKYRSLCKCIFPFSECCLVFLVEFVIEFSFEFLSVSLKLVHFFVVHLCNCYLFPVSSTFRQFRTET